MKMSLKDLTIHVMNLSSQVNSANPSDAQLDEIMVEFEVDDRSERTTITVDSVDAMIYDVLDPKKVKIKLS